MSLRGGGAKKDYAATAEAKRTKRFRCKDSFISLDGREFLYGGDWARRKDEVFARDAMRCQWGTIAMGTKCDQDADDVDHIIKRSDGGGDGALNLRSLCRRHHNMRHKEFQPQLRSIPA
jgi:5-methylcytosine-specific restriction endonuclease McrA